jgi:putative aldouronate transport system permease protein
MFAVSLSDSVHVMKNEVSFWPKGFNLHTYEAVFQDSRISRAFVNTIIYTMFGTFISLSVTAMGAYALTRRTMVFHKTFTLLILFSMFFTGGMIPTFLVVKAMGLMDTVWAMVLPNAVSVWNVILMRTFFAGVPKELEESAKIDGLNDLSIFAKIIIPLSKPALATIGLFYAVALWNNFYLPLLYLRDASLFPLQVILRNIVLSGEMFSSSGTRMGGDNLMVVEESLKYATIIVSTVPILIVYPFLQKYFVKGALIGSIKG